MTEVLFVPDLWLAVASWEPWRTHFRENGVDSRSVPWPRTTGQRKGMGPGVGFAEIVDSVMAAVDSTRATVVVGSGIAGLVAEKVLTTGTVSAAVTIAPLGITQVISAGAPTTRTRLFDPPFPALWRPSNIDAEIELAPDEFAAHFGTHIERAESDSLHGLWSAEGPARVLFQVRGSGITRARQIEEDLARLDDRALLGVITSPRTTAIGAASTADDLRRRYRGTRVQLEVLEYPSRGHSLTIDHGWKGVADGVLDWIARRGPTPPARSPL